MPKIKNTAKEPIVEVVTDPVVEKATVMSRTYADTEGKVKSKTAYFIGAEVEKTPAFGSKTLFVVGPRIFSEVKDMAAQNNCSHIYIGANHCYVGQDTKKYADLIFMLLNTTNLKVTFDFSVLHYEEVYEHVLNTEMGRSSRFIPMIRIPMPNIEKLNRNTTVKIDDKTFDYSNSAVWCHSVDNLMDNNQATMWSEYTQDTVLK